MGGGRRRVGVSRTAETINAPRSATAAIRNVARWKSLKRKETTAHSALQTHCRPPCVRQARVYTRAHANNTARSESMASGDEIRRVDERNSVRLFLLTLSPRPAEAHPAACKVDNNTEPRIFSAGCKSRGKSAPSLPSPPQPECVTV